MNYYLCSFLHACRIFARLLCKSLSQHHPDILLETVFACFISFNFFCTLFSICSSVYQMYRLLSVFLCFLHQYLTVCLFVFLSVCLSNLFYRHIYFVTVLREREREREERENVRKRRETTLFIPSQTPPQLYYFGMPFKIAHMGSFAKCLIFLCLPSKSSIILQTFCTFHCNQPLATLIVTPVGSLI